MATDLTVLRHSSDESPGARSPSARLEDPPNRLDAASGGLLSVTEALLELPGGAPSWRGASMSNSLVGTQLGDFSIVREIGRGGMGVVFEARQISLDRRVALKVLPLNAAFSKVSLARFEREAQAAATLEHPRIVRAYARGEEQGVYYLAMQYIAGMDLGKFVQQQRAAVEQTGTVTSRDAWLSPAPGPRQGTDPSSDSGRARPDDHAASRHGELAYFDQIARLGQQAAEAIDYAHANHIVHRDIKPSNLILDERGNLFVADFGLALLERPGQLTTTGRFLGTLRYSSPEQVGGGDRLDARTDIYSLGATLYELATLQPPFIDRSPGATVKAILDEEPVRPRLLAPDMPRDLEAIILKAMAKSPSRRYQTALEMAVDLQRFLRNEPVRAKRPSRLERAVRWVQRNPLPALLAGVVLTLAGILAIGIAWHLVEQERLLSRLNDANGQLTETLSDLNETLDEERRLRLAVEAAERSARERYYAADLLNINRLAESGQFLLARERLDRHLPEGGRDDLRDFLWRYLDASCNEVQHTLDGHDEAVLSSAYAPGLGLLATGDKNGTVIVWDIRRQLPRTSLKFAGEVPALEFSPDETQLAVGCKGGVIQVYETRQWELSQTIPAHRATVKALVFPPDGKTLISGAKDHHIAYWDTSTWRELRRFLAHDLVQDLSLSADARWLASGGFDRRTRVWDVETGELAAEFDKHGQTVLATALSSDGRLVASGGYDPWACLYDRVSGECLSVLEVDAQTWCLRFLEADSRLLVGSDDGQVRIYDVTDARRPRLLRRTQIHDGIVRTIELMGDGRQLVTGADDRTVRVTPLWQKQIDQTRVVAPTRFAAFSPRGTQFALGHFAGQFARYDRSGVLLSEHSIPPGTTAPHEHAAPPIAFDADDCLWAASMAGDRVHFRAVQPDGRTRDVSIQHTHGWRDIWFSSDARYAAGVDEANVVVVWKLNGPHEIARLALSSNVHDIAISPTGETLAIATGQGEPLLWDVGQNRLRGLTLPGGKRDRFNTLAFDPRGGLLAAGGAKNSVYIWDATTGQPKQEWTLPAQALALTFSRDGKYLATASRELALWQVESGQFVRQLGVSPEVGRFFECLAFSPADDCLIAAADQTEGPVLRIWDTRVTGGEGFR